MSFEHNLDGPAQRIGAQRGHEVVFKDFGQRSGKYEFRCTKCGRSLYQYEGWWGAVMDADCDKKEVKNEHDR